MGGVPLDRSYDLCAVREELQVLDQIASPTYDGALRGSGTDGVMTRPLYTTEEGKTHFRSVPLPLDFFTGRSLAENVLACRTRLGLAVRVKTTDFEEVVKLVQPENYTKFL